MANTYTNLFIHVVFSTKERIKFLNEKVKNELYPYISGIAKIKKFQTPIVNGTDDHIHILLLLKPDISVSKAIQFIKTGSSKWIHERFPELKNFSWQEGYGAFAVSTSQLEKTRLYILNQEDHHKKMDFNQEYRKLLEINNIKFDEKYIF